MRGRDNSRQNSRGSSRGGGRGEGRSESRSGERGDSRSGDSRGDSRGDNRGGGRGGRYNNNRGRGGRSNSGGRSYRGRGGYNSRDPRAASQSGNKRERIALESGFLVLIDQFMLANPQFAEKLLAVRDEAPEAKDQVIASYGGTVVEVSTGTYRIERDPYAYTIVIHGEEEECRAENVIEEAKESLGQVFIDTRCLAMFDRELLDDSLLLSKYQDLWMKGDEKACRDLLRDNGGAVRYGFQRTGDELGVYMVPGEDIVCLWPDVVDAKEEKTEQAQQLEAQIEAEAAVSE